MRWVAQLRDAWLSSELNVFVGVCRKPIPRRCESCDLGWCASASPPANLRVSMYSDIWDNGRTFAAFIAYLIFLIYCYKKSQFICLITLNHYLSDHPMHWAGGAERPGDQQHAAQQQERGLCHAKGLHMRRL